MLWKRKGFLCWRAWFTGRQRVCAYAGSRLKGLPFLQHVKCLYRFLKFPFHINHFVRCSVGGRVSVVASSCQNLPAKMVFHWASSTEVGEQTASLVICRLWRSTVFQRNYWPEETYHTSRKKKHSVFQFPMCTFYIFSLSKNKTLLISVGCCGFKVWAIDCVFLY